MSFLRRADRPVASPDLTDEQRTRLNELAAAARSGEVRAGVNRAPVTMPVAAARALAPFWAERNQAITMDFGLAATFAKYLRDEPKFITNEERYDALVNHLNRTPRRRERLQRLIAEAINGLPDPNAGKVGPLLDRVVADEQKRQVSLRPSADLVEAIYRHAYGWGPLEPFLHDPTVTEIMVVGPSAIFTERTTPQGALKVREMAARFESAEVYDNFVQRLAQRVHASLTLEEPTVDLSLPDRSRVHLTYPPVTATPTITIRKFPDRFYTLTQLEGRGMFSHAMRIYMEADSIAGGNTIFFGEPGSGKTTLLAALLNEKPSDARLIVIEDQAEISIDPERHPHYIPELVSATRDMRELVRDALRMRPDHLVVGETRDRSAYDLMQALNFGIGGSFSTMHASTPERALERLTNLVREAPEAPTEEPARRSVTGAVQTLVHVVQLDDGTRRIAAIDEVHGVDTSDGFRFLTGNVFRTDYHRGADGKFVVAFRPNPAYQMSDALADLFVRAGYDPEEFAATIRENRIPKHRA